MTDQPTRLTIGVTPHDALDERTRLFRALEAAFPVRFAQGPRTTPESLGLKLVASGRDGTCSLTYQPYQGRSGTGRRVPISLSGPLDPRLRGRVLSERVAATHAIPVAKGDVIVATRDDEVVWTRRAADDVVGTDLPELDEGESLRDRVTHGSFLPFVALVEFLRAVVDGGAQWSQPRLRATFIIDDPNLHRPAYGRIDYRRLVEHAQQHRYHVVIATVPLDLWFTARNAAELFYRHGEHISLTVHGSDHRRNEFGSGVSIDRSAIAIAEAEFRIKRFERRHRVSVARVLVPPYESLGGQAAEALAATSYTGVCLTRAYPWCGDMAQPFAAPAALQTLSGWHLADIIHGRLPALLRRQFDEHDELVLRSYLGLPLVLYGHVSDVDRNLDAFAEAAQFVNSLGDVAWSGLDDLFATNVETRLRGHRLEIRPFARSTKVIVGNEFELVVVPPPGAIVEYEVTQLGPQVGTSRRPTAAETEFTTYSIMESRAEAVVPARPRLHVVPIARRLAAESRDRLLGVWR